MPVDFSAVPESITIVRKGGIPNHFRTKIVLDLLGAVDIAGICDPCREAVRTSSRCTARF